MIWSFTLCAIAVIAFHLLHAPGGAAWPLNPFDTGIVKYVNRFAGRSYAFDLLMHMFERHNLLKCVPIVFLLWVAFFSRGESAAETQEKRRTIVAVVPLAIFGVLLARLLAVALPFRERPLHAAVLDFRVPSTINPNALYNWSSFPSDHIVLFTVLVVALFMASRSLGIIGLLYEIFFIMFPRLYAGFHWPTDLLAGAVIGVALAGLGTISAYRDFMWRVAEKCWKISPGLTAGFAFLLSYEIVDLFAAPIEFAKMIWHHLH